MHGNFIIVMLVYSILKKKENMIFGTNWNSIVGKVKEISFDKSKLSDDRNKLPDARDLMITF